MFAPAPTPNFSTPANCAACRRSIRQGSYSFHLASLLLPVDIREPAYAVYAFCRMADDRIDGEEGGKEGIADILAMIGRIYDGRPGPDFVERAFADTVFRFAIPKAVPLALVEGLSWDAEGRRFDDLRQLEAYAARVAGTVGIMMALVMGVRDAAALARAADLGVAMQFTNIARDIGEDAALGRLYMPRDWLRARGVDPDAWLTAPVYDAPVRAVVADLLAHADRLYDRAVPGIAALPRACRPGINAARLLYRAIGGKIRQGVDPVTARAVTGRAEKLRLAALAMRLPPVAQSMLYLPPLDATRFLVEAVEDGTSPAMRNALPPWWDVIGRTRRMIELLGAFAQRERTRLRPGTS